MPIAEQHNVARHDTIDHVEYSEPSLAAMLPQNHNIPLQPETSQIERIQQFNQRGWVGCVIRWLPVAALAVTIMGGVFSYMNHKALDAQRTLKLLKNLQPSLVAAHDKILAGIQSIQEALGIGVTNATGIDPNVTSGLGN